MPDGHGGYHDKKTGEFIAKNVGGRLKFYNQNQVVGGQDPPQKRTQNNQRPVSTQVRPAKKKNSVTTEELRDMYISGKILRRFCCQKFKD